MLSRISWLSRAICAAVVCVSLAGVSPAYGKDHLAELFLRDGGSLNGQAVGFSNSTVSVAPGESIAGTIDFSITSTHNSSAVVPVAGTYTWGLREANPWTIASHVTPGTHNLTANIDLTAPDTPGLYRIILASRGEFTAQQIMSSTSWAHPGGVTWYDENDVGWDWTDNEYANCAQDGWTPIQKLEGVYRDQYVGATYVDVLVEVSQPQPGRWRPVALDEVLYYEIRENRANQGIAYRGASGWVTSQGNLGIPNTDIFNVPRRLSSFRPDWSREVTVDHAAVSNGDEIVHIGDIAYGNGYTYAPIEVDTGATTLDQKLVRFNSSLNMDSTWQVDLDDNARWAGVEYHNGDLYCIEHSTSFITKMPTSRIAVYAADGQLSSERFVQCGFANGVAIGEIESEEIAFISFGGSALDLAIHESMEPAKSLPGGSLFYAPFGGVGVIPLSELSSDSLDPANFILDGWGIYSYAVPALLHAEGLTMDNEGNLWVAKGDEVSKLDLGAIATSRELVQGLSGAFSEIASAVDETTSVVLDNANAILDADTVAVNVYVTGSSSLSVGAGVTLHASTNLAVLDGVVEVSGGLETPTLYVGGGEAGVLRVRDASSEITVSSSMTIQQGGSIEAVAGSTIRMTGSCFYNTSTDPKDYADLINITMVFEGGEGVLDTFEVACQDMGDTTAGELLNFAMGSLVLGGENGIGQLVLVDELDNHPDWEGIEALYLETLTVNEGSTLFLNGMNLYVDGSLVSAGDGDLFGGGTISAVPEPATLSLLAIGGLALLRRRRRA